MTEHHISAGFMPLMDCLVLAVAREKGFAAAEDVDLTLVREISWANIRDRIAVGHFDVAHMLAPMPVAAALGLNPIPASVIAPFALGLNGNAITVSTALWRRMADAGAPNDLDAAGVGAALAKVVKTEGRGLRFAVVHHHSAQNYELRYWLAACDVHPDRDVEIVVVPPPLMTDALKAGAIDGHCVAEPWGSASVLAGAGRIATTKSKIWKGSPEKMLGVSERWANANPQALAALMRACHAAAAWCGDAANHAEAAAILALPHYLNLPLEITVRGVSGHIEVAPGRFVQVDDYFIPHAQDAAYPRPAQALWFYSQMVRWGDVAHSPDHAVRAAACYRPDLFQAALPDAVPPSSQPLQRFFDGGTFDPAKLEEYLASQA
ncbi:MAG TPA: ABC transporter substrate-binding protein [Rhizomicrobium sp.]|nr:ABC transporter substrate-binding protein [Rhizomicrobium sp.]